MAQGSRCSDPCALRLRSLFRGQEEEKPWEQGWLVLAFLSVLWTLMFGCLQRLRYDCAWSQ